MKITKTLASLLVSGACILGSGEKAKSESLFNDNFDNHIGTEVNFPWEVVYFGGVGEPLTYNPGNISSGIDENNYFGTSGKSLFVHDVNTNGGAEVRVNFQPIEKVVLDFYIKPVDSSPFISLRGDKGIDYSLFFDVDDMFKVQDNSGNRINVMPYNDNSWYHITRELDCTTNQGSLFIEEYDNPLNNTEISLGSCPSNGNLNNYVNQFGIHNPVCIYNVPVCHFDNINISSIPELSSLGLLATGLAAGIGAYGLRKK